MHAASPALTACNLLPRSNTLKAEDVTHVYALVPLKDSEPPVCWYSNNSNVSDTRLYGFPIHKKLCAVARLRYPPELCGGAPHIILASAYVVAGGYTLYVWKPASMHMSELMVLYRSRLQATLL
jgi:hypothetical protein